MYFKSDSINITTDYYNYVYEYKHLTSGDDRKIVKKYTICMIKHVYWIKIEVKSWGSLFRVTVTNEGADEEKTAA